MPSVIDAPEVVEREEHNHHEEQPNARTAKEGFWHTVWQYVRGHRVHMASRTRSSALSALRQMESPMARLAQEQPTLYLQGFLGIHNG